MFLAIGLFATGLVATVRGSVCNGWDFDGNITLSNPGIEFTSTFSGASLIFPELHKCSFGSDAIPSVCAMAFADSIENGALASVDCNECITAFLVANSSDIFECAQSCGDNDCANDCDKPLISRLASQCNLLDPYSLTRTTTSRAMTVTVGTRWMGLVVALAVALNEMER